MASLWRTASASSGNGAAHLKAGAAGSGGVAKARMAALAVSGMRHQRYIMA